MIFLEVGFKQLCTEYHFIVGNLKVEVGLGQNKS